MASRPPTSTDDFFTNNGSPPKTMARLRTNRRGAPPPPPPKPASATGGAAAAASPASKPARSAVGASAGRTAASGSMGMTAKSTTSPTRRGPAARRAAARGAAGTTASTGATGAATAGASTKARTLPTMKRAPAATNRPVGNYYLSTTNAGSSNSSSQAASTTATTATASSSAMDWTTPAAAPAATPRAEASSTTSTYNSWAAPAPAQGSINATSATTNAPTASSNDWFTPSAASSSATAPGNNGAYGAQMNSASQFGSNGQGANANATAQGNTHFTNPAGSAATTTASNSASNGFNYSGYGNGMNPMMQGSMDQNNANAVSGQQSNNGTNIMQPQMFIPDPSSVSQSGGSTSMEDFGNEPPLLEELGIFIPHIVEKTKAVVVPFEKFGGHQIDPATITKDADMAGPLAFAILLGFEMSLTGKLQFGYIYGFGLFGCLSMTLVINLMSPTEPVSFWTVTSILGYALIPINVLALVKIVVMNLIQLQTLGRILGLLAVGWSTTASTRLLEIGCGMRDQRYLVAYPIALIYSAFVLITIF